MKKNIDDLHPTQVSVGYLAVTEKQRRLDTMKKKELDDYLFEHKVPVVIGIDKKMYILDHHHLCMAAYNLGIDSVYVDVVEDWSHMSVLEFWNSMKEKQYVWLYDEHGNEISIEDFPQMLPSSIKGCKDDLYRSVAGLVRRAGGYNKDWKPFAEFKWANYFRKYMPLSSHLSELPSSVIKSAINLARSPLASGLPGYSQ